MVSIAMQSYMNKLILKVSHLSNHCVNAIAQCSQIVDGANGLHQKEDGSY